MMGRRWIVTAAFLVLLGACSGQPSPVPTIGSPTPTPSAPLVESDRAEELAEQWDLIGVALPQDWPDVPIPRGSEVLTAFAIGAEPLRTWTATFAGADGTALDLVDPVVAQMRARDYKPIEEFVGKATSNTGLFSFSTPTFSVYLVLGEDAGRPNMVMTIRGAIPESSQPPTGGPR